MDPMLQNYVDWHVKPVMHIRGKYGYRVILKYMDGTEKVQQKSGFTTQRDAEKSREKTLAQLYQGEYSVYENVSLKDFMEFWLEDFMKKTDSQDSYYTYSGIVRNHIVPVLGGKKLSDVTAGDVQKLYIEKAEYSRSVARLVKTVISSAFRYALLHKMISVNPTAGINLPRKGKKETDVDSKCGQKTLTMDQVQVLLEKSRDTPIHMQVLLNVLMGLRRSEIIAVKYSDVDFINQTLTVERQLGQILGSVKEDYAPKTFTKQEIDVKTESSHRILPIPDYVFEAILEERKKYERNRSRRRTQFQDLGYICCSSYGRPRSKNYHWKHYKKLLKECGLPDIRWHDLRATFCTLLLQNFNSKAVSKLMGHAKEVVTVDVYGDSRELITDCTPEIEKFIDEVMPDKRDVENEKSELLDIIPDTDQFFPM